MNTTPNDPKWTAYVLNEVTEAERLELEAELAENPDARAEVEELRELCGLLSDSFGQDPDLSMAPLQKERIHQAARKPGRGQTQWRLPLAAAAALLIGLLGYQLTLKLSPPFSVVMDESDVRAYEADATSPAPADEETGERAAFKMDEGTGDPFGGGPGPKDRTRAPSDIRREVTDTEMEQIPVPEEQNLDSLSERMLDVSSPVVMNGLYSGRAPAPRRSRRQDGRESPVTRSVISPSLDDFDVIRPNTFRRVADHPLSTFSIDVDTASYSIVRKFLKEGNLPPPDAVRVEEMINYFPYDTAAPEDGEAFAAAMELAPAPWKPEHQLVRIALKGREIPAEERPALNLVFLLDVSGSMNSSNRLPLVKRSMTALAKQLD
ncbi:MAG: von Willebrand factor type A domain-containing protein, partial [Kiritimatiellia bacterium]